MKKDRIRFTLRIEQPMKSKIEKEAIGKGISQNQLINNVLIEHYNQKCDL